MYPLQIEKVREADIERWIAECVKAGLIALYSVSGKHYILFPNLGSPRAKVSKFPDPPADLEASLHLYSSEYGCAQTYTDENGCIQTRAYVPYSGSGSNSGTSTGSAAGGGSDAAPSEKKPKNQRSRQSSKDSPLFAKFWQAYPKKVNKGTAIAAFDKLAPDDALLTRMIDALAWQSKLPDWVKDSGQFIPHPSTWLNNRRWEDDPPSAIGPSKRTFPGVDPDDVDCVITIRARYKQQHYDRERAEAELRKINPAYTGDILDAA